MFGSDPGALLGVDTIAHVIQTALTPVFLLSGVASLLGVFSSRLARVSDRSHVLEADLAMATGRPRARLEAELLYLHHRTRILDLAVMLSTAAGGATCMAALLLFVGSLRDGVVSSLLYVSFGLALVLTTGALTAFLWEMMVASRGLRAQQEAAVRLSEARGRDEKRAHDGVDAEAREPRHAAGEGPVSATDGGG